MEGITAHTPSSESMILPLELFEVLINILRDDRPALRSLSLTHRTLTPLAQKHLFYHITLGGEVDDVDNDKSIFLALTDATHEHLLSYIHSLTLKNILSASRKTRSSKQYIPNALTPKLIDAIAPKLTSIKLLGFAPGWEHEDALPLRQSIIRLLSSPTLIHLGLDGVNRFNVGLLSHCSSLKSLRFATPVPAYPTTSSNFVKSDAPIELEELDLSFWGEIAAVQFLSWVFGQGGLCPLSVSKLRCFKINGGSTTVVSAKVCDLLSRCGQTLELLALGPDPFEFNKTPLPPLPSLHTIQFSFRITYYPSPADCLSTNGAEPFPYLIHILSSSSSLLHDNNTLTCIDIHCRLAIIPYPAPPLRIQVDSVTGERVIHQNQVVPGRYDIKASFFDDLVEVLKQAVRSDRLKMLRTVRVGISLTQEHPHSRGESTDYVNYDGFARAYGERFGDFGLLDSDHVQVEIYQITLCQ